VGGWRYNSIILNLGTGWNSVVIFIPPMKQPPVPIRRKEGGRVGLDVVKKRKISYPYRELNSGSSVVQSVSLIPISTELSLYPTGK
jgi:hypothetical protein